MILHLARGVTVEATGPAIHRNDVGCCRWTPLAAAADSAARRTQGESVRFRAARSAGAFGGFGKTDRNQDETGHVQWFQSN